MIIVTSNSLYPEGINIGKWYSDKVNRPLYAPFGAIAALDRQGNIRGALVFTNYNGANIEAHVYAPGCIYKSTLRQVFNYVFNELKCTRLTVIIERSNRKLLKIIPRLNFVFETVLIKYYGPDKKDDGIVYRITPKEAVKWVDINAEIPKAACTNKRRECSSDTAAI